MEYKDIKNVPTDKLKERLYQLWETMSDYYVSAYRYEICREEVDKIRMELVRRGECLNEND